MVNKSCHKETTLGILWETTFEQYGVILKDAKVLRCPVDGEELFTLEQAEAVRKRITALSSRLKLVRKITRAAGKRSIYLGKRGRDGLRVS